MKIGSLCTGYGGLDTAVHNVLGGEIVWCADNDQEASKLLAARMPGVPNLGDITEVDWAAIEPVDVLTGGYPCQPFSSVGKQLGVKDHRHLWPHIREAIRVLRPGITILENVAGHRSRGFSTVLRECAEDGLAVKWASVRASDAGAPHRRERLFFIVAEDSEPPGTTTDRRVDSVLKLLPTPLASDSGSEWSRAADGRRPQLGEIVRGLLPTPRTTDANGAGSHGDGGPDLRTVVTQRIEHGWGKYEEAIVRWERLTRPAPEPTDVNRNGRRRLSVQFAEWMMGLPDGWVTGLDIPRVSQMRLIGNGVVPQQAEIAVRQLLSKE